MSYPLDRYRPEVASTAVPMTLTVNGEQYVLVTPGQPQSHGLLVPAEGTHALQHRVPQGAILHNGRLRPFTPNSTTSYNPNAARYPEWTRSFYTRVFGLLIAGSIVATLIVCLGIALMAVINAAVAHAFAIGTALVAILLGSLAFMSAITKMRHGHAPERGRW